MLFKLVDILDDDLASGHVAGHVATRSHDDVASLTS